ncbi:hypothetical protein GFL91_07435 [Rhizobium leguminosarum bv. viciae]|uniref:Uncharacterized protein n=1 Tax=Rhizobium leguminosarum bv. viciae TaxID=387 RepID=A0A4R0BVS2_RHILV|nr:hypothetical protein [Rhizobium leguminosarum bv. viciae]TBZ08999.1 hypothetical protein E0H33_27295 [Rhizobium leguminosarum bv. viciae]TBZ23297.1 hypothetical protein E0H38_08315 [Rhizobium leguminosarum bv. viciae]TCA02034.1 hypothetical protein E0H57_21505 [Rhizobium leguminosarum bv. viciae]
MGTLLPARAVQLFTETQNRSNFSFTQFRTENRFALFLELLYRPLPRCRKTDDRHQAAAAGDFLK